MTKPQEAESGGSGASSQPQACPDGVGVSLPKSLGPVISRTGPPACPWAALSPEGPSRPEQKPAASGVAYGGRGCVSVPLLRDCLCPCLSHSLFSLWPSLSASFPLSAGLCVCACPCACVCVRSNAPCAPESDFFRVGLAPLSLFLPPCLGPVAARQRFSPPFHFGSLRASTT